MHPVPHTRKMFIIILRPHYLNVSYSNFSKTFEFFTLKRICFTDGVAGQCHQVPHLCSCAGARYTSLHQTIGR